MDILFQKTVTKFLQSLQEVFPEKSDTIGETLKEYDTYQVSGVKTFLNNIKPYYIQISNSDSSIFYKYGELTFFKGIDFSEIWKLGISDNTKNSIWSYLHNLVLVSFAIVSKSATISELIKKMTRIINSGDSESNSTQATAIINIAKHIRENKKQMEVVSVEDSDNTNNALFDITDAKELSDDDNEDESSNDKPTKTTDSDSKDDDDLGFDPTELFEGTKIGQLAKEIAEEIDIDSLGLPNLEKEPENLQDAFSKILGNNPSGLMNTVQNIGSKVQDKIGKSGISHQEMVDEAQSMMSNLHQNPLFKDIFQNSEMGPMFQQMTQMMSQQQKKSQNNNEPFNPMDLANKMMQNPYMKQQQQQQGQQQQGQQQQQHSRSSTTRERLQKKLQQRQEAKQQQSKNNTSQSETI